jgi:hypothetical protein
VQYRSRRPIDSLHMFPEQVDPGGTKNGPAGARWPSLIWRPQIWPPYGLVRRLDIRLLTDAVAAMSDPLPAAIGTGDHFAAIILLNISASADEAR